MKEKNFAILQRGSNPYRSITKFFLLKARTLFANCYYILHEWMDVLKWNRSATYFCYEWLEVVRGRSNFIGANIAYFSRRVCFKPYTNKACQRIKWKNLYYDKRGNPE